VGHVVLLAENLVIELVVGPLDDLFTYTAYLLGLLEIFLTNWFVLEEEIAPFKRFVTYMALHTVRVIVGLVVHYTVAHYLLLAHTALLLVCLMTFCTESIIIFRKKLPVQFLLATMTSEAILVEHFSKSCATIVC